MKNSLVFNLVNLLGFQAGWFVCVLLGNLWALVYTGIFLLAHFYWSSARRTDALAVLLSVVIGLVYDSLLIRLGHIRFAESAHWSPIWLVCLWVLMGLTFHHSLRWVYQRPLWAGALGAVFGPASYLAGVQLSSAQWTSPLIEFVPVMALLWLVILPLHRFVSLRMKPYVSD